MSLDAAVTALRRSLRSSICRAAYMQRERPPSPHPAPSARTASPDSGAARSDDREARRPRPFRRFLLGGTQRSWLRFMPWKGAAQFRLAGAAAKTSDAANRKWLDKATISAPVRARRNVEAKSHADESSRPADLIPSASTGCRHVRYVTADAELTLMLEAKPAGNGAAR